MEKLQQLLTAMGMQMATTFKTVEERLDGVDRSIVGA
jgi:hypothetical protein